MRVVLADLRGRDGYVSKDSVAGGYGSRVMPFSRVSRIVTWFKRRFNTVPSGQLAYVAAIFAAAGHEVVFVEEDTPDADLAIVLTSLVDHRREAMWADAMRARGVRVGAIGLTASKMPELFDDWMDFVVNGEPEDAARRLAAGERLSGRVISHAVANLDELPFPRWDLVGRRPQHARSRWLGRPPGGGFPLVASRGCPEFCTYCPHRILADYRSRSIENVVDELTELCEASPIPYVIFRDPLFTQDRDRMLALCDEIRHRGLTLEFECETRLDRLDHDLLDRLHGAGLRAISFGVESVSQDTLRRVGRRPTPPEHQRAIVDYCRQRGIAHGGLLRHRLPAGRLALDRCDHSLRCRSRIHVRAVQAAHAVSGHAALEAALAAGLRARLAAVRRVHADVSPSLAASRRAALPPWRGVHALLRPIVVGRELVPRPESTGAVSRSPDGSPHRGPSRSARTAQDAAGCMLKAISRYGARVAPGSDRIIRECRRAGTLVQGPAIAAFEDAFATRLKVPRAFTASFGRMAFLYLLRALDLPPGSEVIFPRNVGPHYTSQPDFVGAGPCRYIGLFAGRSSSSGGEAGGAAVWSAAELDTSSERYSSSCCRGCIVSRSQAYS